MTYQTMRLGTISEMTCTRRNRLDRLTINRAKSKNWFLNFRVPESHQTQHPFVGRAVYQQSTKTSDYNEACRFRDAFFKEHGLFGFSDEEMRMTCQTMRLGTISEMTCTCNLITEGYEVFWPVANQGPIDIIAVHADTGEIRLIDVKTVSRRKDGTRVARVTTPQQKALGVEIVEIEIDEHTDIRRGNNPHK